jgi:hypothetical protein
MSQINVSKNFLAAKIRTIPLKSKYKKQRKVNAATFLYFPSPHKGDCPPCEILNNGKTVNKPVKMCGLPAAGTEAAARHAAAHTAQ